MRAVYRGAFAVGILLVLFLIHQNLEHLRLQWNGFRQSHIMSDTMPTSPAAEKAIVMAKLREEDTDWVAAELPEYVFSTET